MLIERTMDSFSSSAFINKYAICDPVSIHRILKWLQGRIYVANEYPTFAKTMSMVSQKLTFLCQITFNVRQNLSVLMKNMQILG
mgnify:CR=1 FL=1